MNKKERERRGKNRDKIVSGCLSKVKSKEHRTADALAGAAELII